MASRGPTVGVMTASAVVTNLPAGVVRPELVGAVLARGTVCQIYARTYAAGTGFVFTTCPDAPQFMATWIMRDRPRSLYVCAAHGRAFAERCGLAIPGVPVLVEDDPFGDADTPYGRVRGAR